MEGIDAGSVRPPLVPTSEAHLRELAQITAAGRAVLADALAVQAAV